MAVLNFSRLLFMKFMRTRNVQECRNSSVCAGYCRILRNNSGKSEIVPVLLNAWSWSFHCIVHFYRKISIVAAALKVESV